MLHQLFWWINECGEQRCYVGFVDLRGEKVFGCDFAALCPHLPLRVDRVSVSDALIVSAQVLEAASICLWTQCRS